MSTVGRRRRELGMDGMLPQSSTTTAIQNSAFINIAHETPVNAPQGTGAYQGGSQGYPGQPGGYPYQGQGYGYNSQPHINSMSSQTAHSRHGSFASFSGSMSNLSMNRFLKHKFGHNGAAGAGDGDDDDFNGDGNINSDSQQDISMDELSHMRGARYMGGVNGDTSTFIPTFSSEQQSRSVGIPGGNTNENYRKQQMMQKKMNLIRFNRMQQQGQNRAMSLQSMGGPAPRLNSMGGPAPRLNSLGGPAPRLNSMGAGPMAPVGYAPPQSSGGPRTMSMQSYGTQPRANFMPPRQQFARSRYGGGSPRKSNNNSYTDLPQPGSPRSQGRQQNAQPGYGPPEQQYPEQYSQQPQPQPQQYQQSQQYQQPQQYQQYQQQPITEIAEETDQPQNPYQRAKSIHVAQERQEQLQREAQARQDEQARAARQAEQAQLAVLAQQARQQEQERMEQAQHEREEQERELQERELQTRQAQLRDEQFAQQPARQIPTSRSPKKTTSTPKIFQPHASMGKVNRYVFNDSDDEDDNESESPVREVIAHKEGDSYIQPVAPALVNDASSYASSSTSYDSDSIRQTPDTCKADEDDTERTDNSFVQSTSADSLDFARLSSSPKTTRKVILPEPSPERDDLSIPEYQPSSQKVSPVRQQQEDPVYQQTSPVRAQQDSPVRAQQSPVRSHQSPARLQQQPLARESTTDFSPRRTAQIYETPEHSVASDLSFQTSPEDMIATPVQRDISRSPEDDHVQSSEKQISPERKQSPLKTSPYKNPVSIPSLKSRETSPTKSFSQDIPQLTNASGVGERPPVYSPERIAQTVTRTTTDTSNSSQVRTPLDNSSFQTALASPMKNESPVKSRHSSPLKDSREPSPPKQAVPDSPPSVVDASSDYGDLTETHQTHSQSPTDSKGDSQHTAVDMHSYHTPAQKMLSGADTDATLGDNTKEPETKLDLNNASSHPYYANQHYKSMIPEHQKYSTLIPTVPKGSNTSFTSNHNKVASDTSLELGSGDKGSRHSSRRPPPHTFTDDDTMSTESPRSASRWTPHMSHSRTGSGSGHSFATTIENAFSKSPKNFFNKFKRRASSKNLSIDQLPEDRTEEASRTNSSIVPPATNPSKYSSLNAVPPLPNLPQKTRLQARAPAPLNTTESRATQATTSDKSTKPLPHLPDSPAVSNHESLMNYRLTVRLPRDDSDSQMTTSFLDMNVSDVDKRKSKESKKSVMSPLSNEFQRPNTSVPPTPTEPVGNPESSTAVRYTERSRPQADKSVDLGTTTQRRQPTKQTATRNRPSGTNAETSDIKSLMTVSQLGILNDSKDLMKELQIVSTELAGSISRELALESKLRSSDQVEQSTLEGTQDSAKVSELASKLAEERRKRYAIEELLLKRSNGANDGSQLAELGYKNTKLRDRVVELEERLRASKAHSELLDTEHKELSAKLAALTTENRKLKNSVLPDLRNQVEILTKNGSGDSLSDSNKYDELRLENKRMKQEQLNGSDDLTALQAQRDSLREALKNLKAQRDVDMRINSEKIRQQEVQVNKLTLLNSQLSRKLGQGINSDGSGASTPSIRTNTTFDRA